MSLLTYQNSQEAFIGKHIHAALQTDGYETSDINRGIQEALRFYQLKIDKLLQSLHLHLQLL